MLEEKYPDLANFLGSWFPDADLEGLTDNEVTRKFMSVVSTAELEKVRSQCRSLLSLSSLPVQEIIAESNRHFVTEEDCREWLTDVCRTLG